MQIKRVTLDEMKRAYASIEECWDEVDQRKAMSMVLNPDWNIYKELEKTGRLFLYIVGERGFISVIASPDLHRKGHLSAVTDVIWIEKEMRGGFFRAVPVIEEDLIEAGVDILSITVKSREEDEIYGYSLYEKTYQRRL